MIGERDADILNGPGGRGRARISRVAPGLREHSAVHAKGHAIVPIAVLGCGGWGRNIVRTMAFTGHLAAVVDLSKAGREAAASLAPAFGPSSLGGAASVSPSSEMISESMRKTS